MNTIFGKSAPVIALASVRETKMISEKNDSLGKLIGSILGETPEGPTKFEIMVSENMKALALAEHGEYDEDDMSIHFGSEEGSLVLYAFIEENDEGEENEPDQYVNYQVVADIPYPKRRFIVSDIAPTPKSALQSLRMKQKNEK